MLRVKIHPFRFLWRLGYLLTCVDNPTDERVTQEWGVQAPAGSIIELTARHERAGCVDQLLSLGSGNDINVR